MGKNIWRSDASEGESVRLAGVREERNMNKLNWVGGVVLAAGLAALPVLAQEAAKKEPPKPPLSPTQAVLEQWNDIDRKSTRLTSSYPENKYEFNPLQEQRNLPEALH